jgi:ribosomal protein S6
MKTDLDQKQLGVVEEKLGEFEVVSYWNRRELEAVMEALASQIYILMKSKEEPESLTDAVELLPIPAKVKRRLGIICDEIQEVMDTADYDIDDDIKAESIDELKADFVSILDAELQNLSK